MVFQLPSKTKQVDEVIAIRLSSRSIRTPKFASVQEGDLRIPAFC